MADRHIDYYRRTDMDVMKVMNDTGYGPIETFTVREVSDWNALEPTPLSESHFQSHLEGLKRIVDAVGDEVLVMTTAFNPYHEAVMMLMAGDRKKYPTEHNARMGLLEQLRREPEPVLHAMAVIAGDLGRFYKACVTEAGVDGIYYSAQGGERADMSNDEHSRFLKPFDTQVLGEVGPVAEFIVGHFCGQSLNLERFADYPIQLANWAHQSDNPSLTKGRAILGDISILGGLDERGPLVYGPWDALEQEIEQAVEEMGTKGFMLGAGCTVPGDVDIENLIYAREFVGRLTSD